MTHEEKIAMARNDLAEESLPAIKIYRDHTEKNPGMYDAFEDETLKLIGRGYKRFSQWMVANHVRYLYHMQYQASDGGNGELFKVPNGVIGIWARRFIVRHPEHDVFNIKRLSRRWA